jgi:hypothetical protein
MIQHLNFHSGESGSFPDLAAPVALTAAAEPEQR